jgi:hypothetical protein
MSEWNDPKTAPFNEDFLVKRDIGTYHVAMRVADKQFPDGRWIEYFCNKLEGIVGWKNIET